MSRSISILVADIGTGKDALPQFLVEKNGAWQDCGCGSKDLDLSDVHVKLAATLEKLMTAVDEDPTRDVVASLAKGCGTLYEKLLPEKLRTLLEQAANDTTEPSTIRLHCGEKFDWIPWELLKDKSDFLSIRFQMARLPISPSVPDLDEEKPREVSTIDNLIGSGVFQNGSPLLTEWQATFAPPAHIRHRVKTDATFNDVRQALVDDVLHLTCHGAYDEEDTKYYWTMNPADPLGSLNGIDKDFIAGQRLQNGRPLVFANACAHTGKLGGLVSGLGRELFSSGAQNTIGALARISQRVAIPFAQKFYAHLLGNNEPIGLALCNTKREFHTGATDPSHLFYCLYGPPGSRFEYVPST